MLLLIKANQILRLFFGLKNEANNGKPAQKKRKRRYYYVPTVIFSNHASTADMNEIIMASFQCCNRFQGGP